MRTLLLMTFVFTALNIFCQPTVTLVSRITGLANPMQIANAGDNTHRIFVVEKNGTIKVFNSSYSFVDTLLRITGINTGGEQGLLSMAFHPDFRTNGHFYVYYTAPAGTNSNILKLDRYTISSTNPNRANPGSRLELLSINHPATNHNGGKINFGRDGFLYLATGDSGGGGDPGNAGQTQSSLLGKMLRLNVDATSQGKNYAIPAGNPFNTEVFSLGLRNPFRWNFDRLNNDVYIGDVGQNAKEELNFRPLAQMSGANFGWRCYEGFSSYNTGGCLDQNQYISPVNDYTITSTAKSIIGGMVYRGYKYPALKNWYFYIDYFNSNMLMVNRSQASWTPAVQNVSISAISDFSETEDGEVLICRNANPGVVYELTTTTNQRQIYTFSGSGNWSDASNWKNGSLPPNPLPANGDIVIKPYKGGSCTINVSQMISSGSALYIEPGANLVVSENINVTSVKSFMRKVRAF